MSKRRNVKKEKASRNRAYARQFRKKFSHSSKGRRFFNKDEKSEGTQENNSSSSQSNSNS